MGKNKLSKFADMEKFERVFQYPFARLQTENFPFKGQWHEAVFGNDAPIVLELGCGRGEYTVALAERCPNKNFIGIDIKGARMWAGAKIANDQHLANAAFLRTDIEQLTHFFAPEEVAEIWITFPDPQMKKVRKRLVGTRFLSIYEQFLRKDGLIHLKTDSPFLFTYTKLLLCKNAIQPKSLSDNVDRDMGDNGILSIRTYYEQQWRDRGLDIKYVSFGLDVPAQDLQEPNEEIPYDEYRSYNRSKRSEKQFEN